MTESLERRAEEVTERDDALAALEATTHALEVTPADGYVTASWWEETAKPAIAEARRVLDRYLDD